MKNRNSRLGVSLKCCVAALMLISTCSFDANAGVIAHWKFDQQDGTTVPDSVGAFHGTMSAAGAALVSGGVSGNALSLSKTQNGYVNIGNVLGLMSGDFSFVAWIKMNEGDRTDSSIFFGKHASGSRNGYFLNVNKTAGALADDKVAFFQGSGAVVISPSDTPISQTSVNDGTWHQIVAVYEAGNTKCIYVDGAPVETCRPSQPMVPNNVPLLIGGICFSGVPAGMFTGLIDEVQVYNHALTSEDVDFLYQNPAATALDCSGKLAQANATISALETALSIAQGQNLALQQDANSISASIQAITQHFRTAFKDPQFQIPGSTDVQRMENLRNAIKSMNSGQLQTLYSKLGGRNKP